MARRIGKRLGSYEIVGSVGAGGMGEVRCFLAGTRAKLSPILGPSKKGRSAP